MMKLPILLALAATAFLLPACTTVHNEPRAPTSTTSTTTEEHTMRSPVGAASTSTTVRSY